MDTEQNLQEQIEVLKEQFRVACDRCEKWKELALLYRDMVGDRLSFDGSKRMYVLMKELNV